MSKRATSRPPGHRPPAHLSPSPPVPEPREPEPQPAADEKGRPDPVRYGDWERKGVAVDF